VSWSQTGERKIFGPDLVTEAEEKVKTIQNNLKAAQSRQQSYADMRRRPLQFQIGDFVYLRVSPTQGVQRFGVKGKLAPRYIGPFEILKIYGPIAYRLQLPPQLAAIHYIFHVSQLRKCVKVPTEIIDPQAIEIESDLTYTEHLIRVLDTKERSTRREIIKILKISGIIILKKKRLGKPNSIFNEISLYSRISRQDSFRGEGCDIQVLRIITH
jgi:hypothetical protein